MATVETLKNKDNNTFYPVTKTEAVYNADGSENLSVTLTGINTTLGTKATVSTDAGDANKMMKADGTKALVTSSNIDFTTLTSTDYTPTDLPAHSSGTNNFFLYEKLGIATFTVNQIWANSVDTSWLQIATIPAAICPKYQHTGDMIIVESTNGLPIGYGKVILETNGKISIRPNTSRAALTGISFTLSWSIN